MNKASITPPQVWGHHTSHYCWCSRYVTAAMSGGFDTRFPCLRFKCHPTWHETLCSITCCGAHHLAIQAKPETFGDIKVHELTLFFKILYLYTNQSTIFPILQESFQLTNKL